MLVHLRDILPKDKNVDIEYRCNGPKDEYGDEEDMLFGFCRWIDNELISGDGDNYYLGDVVRHHEWDGDNYLTVWIEVEWNSKRRWEI
jgi:hypothetical protein